MRTPIPDYLREVLEAVRGDDSGEPADYIPELARADLSTLGVAVTSTRGSTYAAGDVDREFSIQSISKPFAYAAALMDRGAQRVLQTVAVEPSGEAFNELSLDDETRRPKNAMINAGAIATHALLVGADADREARVERVVSMFSALAGRTLRIDESVYRSELETAERNYALAHMLRSYGMLDHEAHDAVEGYTAQCSVLVTVRDLSVMAATLATGGVQPVTGERLMSAEVARQVMAVMASSGMYDGAGDWLTRVGIPAKSGVAGGLVGALPGQVGIGAVSPRLDEHGNSYRARRVFERLADDMGLHLFSARNERRASIVVRNEGGTTVIALEGNVQFTVAAELLDRMQSIDGEGPVRLDVERVHEFTEVGRRMALEGLRRLRLDGHQIELVDPDEVLPDPDLGDGSRPDVVTDARLH